MSAGTAAALNALRLAVSDRRRLLAVSRPATWIAGGLPFVVGALDAHRAVSMPVILGAVYFLGPFQLLRHGLRTAGGADTDTNEGAPGTEVDAGTSGVDARGIRIAIVISNLPLLAAIVLLGGPAAGAALLGSVALAVAESSRQVRLRTRPGLDLATASLLLVLPAVGGLLLGGREVAELPWAAIGALLAWGVASSALAAIRDLGSTRMARRSGTTTVLGARPTAVIAAAGYGAAVALVASLGPVGSLAAIGLALFLLLPAMVLVEPAGSTTPNTARPAGERALAELPGLTALVGAWIAILLLLHWGIAPVDAWTPAILVPAVIAGYALANVVAIRIATRRRRIPSTLDAPGTDVPSLTIVVPCRNDAATLPATLISLRDQTYADVTIRVVDDDSTDGSRDEAAAWSGEDAVVRAPPRPPGWRSRDWARRVGASAATTDLVLFVDPTTVLAPIAARIMVEQLGARGADLLVGLTRDAMPTHGERAAVPGVALLRYGFAPIWWSAVMGGRPVTLAFGGGPLVLVRRDAADRPGGGDERVPGRASSRLGLSRAYVRRGKRIGAVRMANLAATRRHRDARSVVAAWRRLIVPFGGGRLAGALAIIIVEATAFVAPLLLPPMAIIARLDRVVIVASFVPLLTLVAMRLALAIVDRQPVAVIAWHPVTMVLTILGQVVGIADHVLGRARS